MQGRAGGRAAPVPPLPPLPTLHLQPTCWSTALGSSWASTACFSLSSTAYCSCTRRGAREGGRASRRQAQLERTHCCMRAAGGNQGGLRGTTQIARVHGAACLDPACPPPPPHHHPHLLPAPSGRPAPEGHPSPAACVPPAAQTPRCACRAASVGQAARASDAAPVCPRCGHELIPQAHVQAPTAHDNICVSSPQAEATCPSEASRAGWRPTCRLL